MCNNISLYSTSIFKMLFCIGYDWDEKIVYDEIQVVIQYPPRVNADTCMAHIEK